MTRRPFRSLEGFAEIELVALTLVFRTFEVDGASSAVSDTTTRISWEQLFRIDLLTFPEGEVSALATVVQGRPVARGWAWKRTRTPESGLPSEVFTKAATVGRDDAAEALRPESLMLAVAEVRVRDGGLIWPIG